MKVNSSNSSYLTISEQIFTFMLIFCIGIVYNYITSRRRNNKDQSSYSNEIGFGLMADSIDKFNANLSNLLATKTMFGKLIQMSEIDFNVLFRVVKLTPNVDTYSILFEFLIREKNFAKAEEVLSIASSLVSAERIMQVYVLFLHICFKEMLLPFIEENELTPELYEQRRNLGYFSNKSLKKMKNTMFDKAFNSSKHQILVILHNVIDKVAVSNKLNSEFMSIVSMIIMFTIDNRDLSSLSNDKKLKSLVYDMRNDSEIYYQIDKIFNQLKDYDYFIENIETKLLLELEFYYNEYLESFVYDYMFKNYQQDQLLYYIFTRAIYFSINKSLFKKAMENVYFKNQMTQRLSDIQTFLSTSTNTTSLDKYLNEIIIGRFYFIISNLCLPDQELQFHKLNDLIDKEYRYSLIIEAEKVNCKTIKNELIEVNLNHLISEANNNNIYRYFNSILLNYNHEAKIIQFESRCDSNTSKYIFSSNKTNKHKSQDAFNQMIKLMSLSNSKLSDVPNYLYFSYIKSLFSSGNLEEFNNLLDRIIKPVPNIVLYTEIYKQVLLLCYCNSNDCISSVNLIKDLNENKIGFPINAYGSLMKLYSSLNAEEKILEKFDEMIENDIKPSTEVYCALIDIFLKKKRYDNAYGIFLDIKQNKLCFNDYTDILIFESFILIYLSFGKLINAQVLIDYLVKNSTSLKVDVFLGLFFKKIITEIEKFSSKTETTSLIKHVVKLTEDYKIQLSNDLLIKINSLITKETNQIEKYASYNYSNSKEANSYSNYNYYNNYQKSSYYYDNQQKPHINNKKEKRINSAKSSLEDQYFNKNEYSNTENGKTPLKRDKNKHFNSFSKGNNK